MIEHKLEIAPIIASEIFKNLLINPVKIVVPFKFIIKINKIKKKNYFIYLIITNKCCNCTVCIIIGQFNSIKIKFLFCY